MIIFDVKMPVKYNFTFSFLSLTCISKLRVSLQEKKSTAKIKKSKKKYPVIHRYQICKDISDSRLVTF